MSNTQPPSWLHTVSLPLVQKLSTLPRWLAPVVMLALTLIGLFSGGVVGLVCLGLVALFLGWLVALSWSVLPTAQRAMRLVVVVVVAAGALLQLR